MVKKRLNKETKDLIETRVQEELEKREAVQVTMEEAVHPGLRDEEGFRPITGAKVQRDLDPVTQDKMIRIAMFLYDANPLAKRILDTKRDFLVGEGVTVEAEDKGVDEIVQKFWHDPINQMDVKIGNKVLELRLFGEQVYPVFVNQKNGHVRLGYLDPAMIDRVIPNPNNIEELIGIRVKDVQAISNPEDEKFVKQWGAEHSVTPWEGEKKYLSIITLNRKARGPEAGRLMGDCFFFAINKVSNALRGRSDLLSLADNIYNFERFLFNRSERARHLNAFFWDILLKGYNEEQIKKWLGKQGIPKPGTMRAHNERVEWNPVTPKMESGDASNEAKIFRSYIAGGAGLPVHWLGGGEGLTRACFSSDTQVLTENGWKYFWEVNEGEKLADYNPKADSIEFRKPLGFFLYPYSGKMFHFKNVRTDILVTPEHRMWAREGHSKKWSIVQAKNLKWNSFYFKEAPGHPQFNYDPQEFYLPDVPYSAQSRTTRKIPEKLDLFRWCRFLGWFISEGCLHIDKRGKRFAVQIAQKNPENCKKISTLLMALRIPYKWQDNGKGVTKFIIHDKSLWFWLKANTGEKSGEKRIPRELFTLPPIFLNAMFETLMLGDGHTDLRPGRNNFFYATKSEQLADDFQELALRLGYSARKSFSLKRVGKKCFKTFIISFTPIRDRQLQNRKTGPKHIRTEDYSGLVYCYKMPNDFMITRRNGKIAIQLQTAIEMSAPVFKQLKYGQQYLKHMILYILQFVIDQAIIHGRLKPNVNTTVHVTMPALSQKDMLQLSTSLASVSTALSTAVEYKLTSREEAKKVFAFVVSLLGQDVSAPPVEDEEQEDEFKDFKNDTVLARKLGLNV